MIFKVAYTRLGVLNGICRRLIYDSAANSLALTTISASSTAKILEGKTKISSYSQAQSQFQSRKKLSAADQTKLIQSIVNNGFFQTDGVYPPDPMGPQDYILRILAVAMDQNLHTVLWAETSSDVPSGLNSIVETMQDIASK
jgi:hypothetical protein